MNKATKIFLTGAMTMGFGIVSAMPAVADTVYAFGGRMDVVLDGVGTVQACIYSDGSRLYARANTGWESARVTSSSGSCTLQDNRAVTSYKLCEDIRLRPDPCTLLIYP
jgi:hypothetical protein